ncbi:27844_t:CDS:2, partial [Dentiscutata erythropus]
MLYAALKLPNHTLEALKSGSSTSTKRQQNTKDPISQTFRSVSKILSTNKNNTTNKNVIDVEKDIDDIQNETAETSSRSSLNEISTNILEDPFTNTECEITNKILEQNILIMEKQKTLETTLTQLTNNVKTLESSYENLKSKTKEKEYD